MSNRICLIAGIWAAMSGFAEYAGAGTSAPTSQPVQQQIPANEDELRAVETARAALARRMYIRADTLPVLRIEKRSWPSTGLGCASPDTATIRITRHGYVIELATPAGPRRMHVAGRQAIICDQPQQKVASSDRVAHSGPAVASGNLSLMVEQARSDLARRLDTPANTVRLVSFNPMTWPDSTMNCAVPYEQTRDESISGYELQLWHGERMFIYHTDLVRTRACPPIETPEVKSSASGTSPATGRKSTAATDGPRAASGKAAAATRRPAATTRVSSAPSRGAPDSGGGFIAPWFSAIPHPPP